MPDDRDDYQKLLTYWERCAEKVGKDLKEWGITVADADHLGKLTDNAPDARIENAVHRAIKYYFRKALENDRFMNDALDEAKEILE